MKLLLRYTFRKLLRNGRYAFLNILGLGVGFTCCLLIYLSLSHDLSFDQFHPNLGQLYRVSQTNIWVDSEIPFSATGPGVAHALKEVPEIEQVLRIHTPGSAWVQREGQAISFKEDHIFASDSNFMDFFGYELNKGETTQLLDAPNSLVLTTQTAEKYFGDENPVNQLLSINFGNGFEEFVVKGVIESGDTPSHINFDMLISMTTFPLVRERSWSWVWTTFVTYIKLRENTLISEVQEKINRLPPKYAGQTLKWVMGYDSFEDFKRDGKKWELPLEPVADIYLKSHGNGNRLGPLGDIRYVYAFAGTALLILLLSCINYINLTTAKALDQVQEVGIQKTLGASRKTLMLQAWIEAMVLSSIGCILAILMTDLLLIPFNELTGKQLRFTVSNSGVLIPALFVFSWLVGSLAGAYPGWHISTFRTGMLIKPNPFSGASISSLRNGMVTFQFVISISLIICTAFVYKQIRYVASKDLGFSKEQVVVVGNGELLKEKQALFSDRIATLSGLIEVAQSDAAPPRVYNSDYFRPLDSEKAEMPLAYLHVDEAYIPAMGISLLAGRNFSEAYGTETQNVVLNAAAASAMGWHMETETDWDSYLGKRLQYPGDGENTYTVIGIVSDFNFWSLQSKIQPLALFYEGSGIFSPNQRYFTLKMGRDQHVYQSTLAEVEAIWKELVPEIPFTYSFMDDDFSQAFAAEKRLSKVLGVFSLVAVFIACLGLLGLSSYAIEKRSKEIGIRKILGASVPNILTLIGKEYIQLVLIAFVVASPLAYFIMNSWLANYAYRTSLSWDVFFLSGILGIGITVVTVGLYSLKAANQSPILSLRDE